MKIKYILVAIFLIAFSASACSTTKKKVNLMKCPDERPEMCTMQFDPVCGILNDDTRKTFSNACSACANKLVIGYQQGECVTN